MTNHETHAGSGASITDPGCAQRPSYRVDRSDRGLGTGARAFGGWGPRIG